MIGAAEVSVQRAGLSPMQRDSIRHVLERFGLPTQLTRDFPRDEIVQALAFDKKFKQGEVRFVVTPAVGCAELSAGVTMDDIRHAVDRL